MSYIVPQKMPLRCFECGHISLSTIAGYSCKITHKSIESEHVINESEHVINVRRPVWCPLVELPPHGRLVDADKLMMSLADWWYSSFGEEETDEAKAIRTVMDKIEQSIGEMTVVEAEGREE